MRALLEQNKVVNTTALQTEYGMTRRTFDGALLAERARMEGWVDGAATSKGVEILYGPKEVKPPTKVHPVAEWFPMIEGEAFDALVEDIKANGLLTPIVVQGDTLLDGRNRRAACAQAGVAPRFEAFTGPDPVAFIISQNIKRRHLDESQLGLIGAKWSTMKSGARTDLASIEARSQPQAAREIGVSRSTVQRGVKVLAEAKPAVIAAVEQGNVSLNTAIEINTLKLDDDVLHDLVTLPKTDIPTNVAKIKKGQKRDATFKRIQAEAAAVSQSWPTGRYSVIYADPPTEDEYGHTKRDTENHYPTMTWEEVKDLAVGEITTDDAVCYLWATPHTIHRSLEVMHRWGFDYRTHMVWSKTDGFGLGAWVRNEHEILLIGRKGKFPPPPEDKRIGSVVELPAGDHSAKPEEFAEMIESWYPDAVKLELFRRGPPRKGWVAWGFETGMVAA